MSPTTLSSLGIQKCSLQCLEKGTRQDHTYQRWILSAKLERSQTFGADRLCRTPAALKMRLHNFPKHKRGGTFEGYRLRSVPPPPRGSLCAPWRRRCCPGAALPPRRAPRTPCASASGSPPPPSDREQSCKAQWGGADQCTASGSSADERGPSARNPHLFHGEIITIMGLKFRTRRRGGGSLISRMSRRADRLAATRPRMTNGQRSAAIN